MLEPLPVSPLSADRSARPSRRKPSSQTRRRRHRGVGHYDEREYAAYLAACERYRKSAAADAHGGSESAFIRYMTIGEGARKLPPRRVDPGLPPDLVDELGRLLAQLGRDGNNLNQIARHQNAGRTVLPTYMQAVHDEYRETMRAIRRALGWED